jgi:regulator of sigma E protease
LFSNIATNLIAFVIVLGVLIFAHEAGHFFMAKLFKVRVLVFSFGFGKRLFGFRTKETDYRVSLIPLGGYVKMAGDIPEEGQEHAPDEFLAKPKWQRFLILVAGAGVNVVLAVVLLTGWNMAGNEVISENRPIIASVQPGKPAERAGLRGGDQVVRINKDEITTWDDLRLLVSMHPDTPLKVTYVRDGVERVTTMTPEKVDTEFGTTGMAGMVKFLDSVVGRTVPESAAAKAGLQKGDRIVAANGKPISDFSDLEEVLNKAKGNPVPLEIARGTATISLTLPSMGKGSKVSYPGIIPPTEIRKLGLTAAFRESIDQNMKMLRYTFVTLGRLFRLKGSVKELSGPISIARISGEMLRSGWKELVLLMASISLQLGVMNLLPIPVLDGGHILILLLEGVARRDFSLQVKERIQTAGFLALVTLMVFVLYNDVVQNVMLMRRG